MTVLSCSSSSSSSVTAAAAAAVSAGGALKRCFSSAPPPKPQKLPPNLIIDPRSQYAPVKKSELPRYSEEWGEEEEGTEEGDLEQQATKEQEDLKSSSRRRESEQHDEEDDEDEDEEDDQEDYPEDDDDDDDSLYIPAQEISYAIPLPQRLHVPVHTFFAPHYESQVGTLWLHDLVFGRDPIRVDLLKRAVNYIRAKKRGYRKVKVKTVSEKRGSGRKLRPQKGQGRARVGHGRDRKSVV